MVYWFFSKDPHPLSLVAERPVATPRKTYGHWRGLRAGRTFVVGWACYREWIRWVWQGKVNLVIAALSQRQAELGLPEKDEAVTSPRQVVSKTLTYLENHQDKMQYDVYRRDGLPITSSLMESAVKQINQRVKGSEKFWSEAGSEAVLQLRADQLS